MKRRRLPASERPKDECRISFTRVIDFWAVTSNDTQSINGLKYNAEEMHTDTGCSIRDIRSRYKGLLVPQLLEIQNHRTGVEKSIEWARNLQCLYLVSSGRKRRRAQGDEYVVEPAKLLRRTTMCRDQSNSSYVAVSWSWEPSEWENPDTGSYKIQSVKGASLVPSEVRDVVLDRVTAYTRHHNVSGFWIDKECINQKDPEEKEIAMQSMDLVYSMSKHPLGLLTRPIESQAHLNLLPKLLCGEFMGLPDHPNFPHLKPSISPETAIEALKLLDRITSDPWWERAWIFQEEYLSSVHMDLLIPHSPFPVAEKRPCLEGGGRYSRRAGSEFSRLPPREYTVLSRISSERWSGMAGWHRDL